MSQTDPNQTFVVKMTIRRLSGTKLSRTIAHSNKVEISTAQ